MANVSARYAEALFKTKGKSKYQKHLEVLSTLYTNNDEFKNAINNPQIKDQEKLEIIKEVTLKDEVFMNFIDLVLKENRINLIEEISNSFTAMINKENKQIKIEIISAYELDKKQINEIAEIYKKMKKAASVDVITKIDKSIIGGIKVIVDGTIYDDSLKTKLIEML